MKATTIGTSVIGVMSGALAGLTLPGKQAISVAVTAPLGALGSVLGSWSVCSMGNNHANAGFKDVAFLAGVLMAATSITIYVGVIARRHTRF